MMRDFAEPVEQELFENSEPREKVTALDLKEMVQMTRWLWPGWLALGHISVLAGESGIGKSWLALALAKVAAHGLTWPDETPGAGEEGPVLWLESEGRHGLLLERAERVGMKPNLLCFMEKPLRRYYLDDGADSAEVYRTVDALKPCLVVVDCWSKSLLGAEGSLKVRHCLDELHGLARHENTPILLVHHLRKRQGLDRQDSFDFDRLRGSSALAQIASCVMGVDRPTQTGGICRVTCGKSNLGAAPNPFGFTITDEGLTFCEAPEPERPPSRLEEAEAFLRRALAEGPMTVAGLREEAKEAGIGRDTLYEARHRLCSLEFENAPLGSWIWRLRPTADEGDATGSAAHRIGEEPTA